MVMWPGLAMQNEIQKLSANVGVERMSQKLQADDR